MQEGWAVIDANRRTKHVRLQSENCLNPLCELGGDPKRRFIAVLKEHVVGPEAGKRASSWRMRGGLRWIHGRYTQDGAREVQGSKPINDRQLSLKIAVYNVLVVDVRHATGHAVENVKNDVLRYHACLRGEGPMKNTMPGHWTLIVRPLKTIHPPPLTK